MTNSKKLEFIEACRAYDKDLLIKFWSNYTGQSVDSFKVYLWKEFFLRKAIEICKECLQDYTFVEYVLDSYNSVVTGIHLSITEYWIAKVALLEDSQFNHYKQ